MEALGKKATDDEKNGPMEEDLYRLRKFGFFLLFLSLTLLGILALKFEGLPHITTG